MDADVLQRTLFMMMGGAPVFVMVGYIIGSLRQDWSQGLSLATIGKFLVYPPTLMRPERRRGFWIALVLVAVSWTSLLAINRYVLTPMFERQTADREMRSQERNSSDDVQPDSGRY